MKKLLPLFIALLYFTDVKAQYVTIPDANFAAYLQSAIPSAMNGNLMDTTNMAVTIKDSLIVSKRNITNLSGVQYFSSLQYLNCDSNAITTIPKLPTSLTYLDCSHNQLTSLPPLPNTLSLLYCYSNQLTSLPPLPNSLDTVICYYNQLSNLPALPSSLLLLWCNSNQLVSLPTLPNSIQSLACDYNQITSLPILPPSLQELYCDHNQLANLPALPNALSLLYCDSNQLTSLPTLPNSLESLYCKSNQLTSLPTFPSSLQYLDCSYNQLITIPVLPFNIRIVLCNNNNIACFPVFPDNNNSNGNPLPQFLNLNISSNQFNCLPNYIPIMGSDTVTYPLCAVGNANGCAVATGIHQLSVNINPVTVYPNPAQNSLQVLLSNEQVKELKLYDVLGYEVKNEEVKTQNGVLQIDVSNLQNGVYFIKLLSGDNIYSSKFIKD